MRVARAASGDAVHSSNALPQAMRTLLWSSPCRRREVWARSQSASPVRALARVSQERTSRGSWACALSVLRTQSWEGLDGLVVWNVETKRVGELAPHEQLVDKLFDAVRVSLPGQAKR